jgi:hypothetical protein
LLLAAHDSRLAALCHLVGRAFAEGADEGAADAFEADARGFEEHDGDALAFADQGKEEVKGFDLSVVATLCLRLGGFEDAFDPWGRTWIVCSNVFFAATADEQDRFTKPIGSEFEVGEDACSRPPLFTRQPDQQMLGADIGMGEQPCLFLRQCDRIGRARRQAFKHEISNPHQSRQSLSFTSNTVNACRGASLYAKPGFAVDGSSRLLGT